MLEQLSEDVALVVTDQCETPQLDLGFRCVQLPKHPILFKRLLNRLGLLQKCPWENLQSRWLLDLAMDSSIDRIVVHFLTWATRFAKTWESIKKPVFVFCHGFDVTWDMLQYCDRQRLHSQDYRLQVRSLPENVSFVANSQVTQNRLLSIGIEPKRIQVFYAGVPLAPEPKLHRDKPEVTILYLGRLVDCKGPDLLIQAFELASREGMSGQLLIAGDGPLRQTCDRIAGNSPFSDKIHLLGSVNEKQGLELRNRADIFAAHSQTGPVTGQEEAYGIGFLEAMGIGLPIVSGCNGALPEIVRDGLDGLLVPPGNVQAQADALRSLAHSAKRRNLMGHSAWERVRSRFNQETQTVELRTLLN